MNNRTVAALVYALLLMGSIAAPSWAQTNPFLAPAERDAGPSEESINREEAPGLEDSQFLNRSETETRSLLPWTPFPRLSRALRQHHRVLNEQAAELIEAVRDPGLQSGRRSGIVGLAVLSVVVFLYGLIHAALPGHRKVLLVSYFVAHDAPLRHAVFAGVGVALIHSGAAAVVVLGAYYLVQTSLSMALESANLYIQGISATIILVIGALILGSKIREFVAVRKGTHSCDDELEERALGVFRMKFKLLPAIVLSSMIPCPGSAMILMFAISLGVPLLGVFATSIFSLGMAVTLVGVSLAALMSKRAVVSILDGRTGEYLHIGLEGMAGCAMLAMGLLMLTTLT